MKEFIDLELTRLGSRFSRSVNGDLDGLGVGGDLEWYRADLNREGEGFTYTERKKISVSCVL